MNMQLGEKEITIYRNECCDHSPSVRICSFVNDDVVCVVNRMHVLLSIDNEWVRNFPGMHCRAEAMGLSRAPSHIFTRISLCESTI